jgi:hypothetical protein
VEVSGKTRFYHPCECIFLVVGMQVQFLKYETGPGTLLKGTSPRAMAGKDPLLPPLRCNHTATRAVGYDVTQMGTFHPKVNYETLEYVIYEQVYRNWRNPTIAMHVQEDERLCRFEDVRRPADLTNQARALDG